MQKIHALYRVYKKQQLGSVTFVMYATCNIDPSLLEDYRSDARNDSALFACAMDFYFFSIKSVCNAKWFFVRILRHFQFCLDVLYARCQIADIVEDEIVRLDLVRKNALFLPRRTGDQELSRSQSWRGPRFQTTLIRSYVLTQNFLSPFLLCVASKEISSHSGTLFVFYLGAGKWLSRFGTYARGFGGKPNQ